MIKVVILGGGNVAYHLTSNLLENNTVEVVQVYNRNLEHIKHLANKISITNDIKQLKTADIYIISVSDNAISELSSQLNFPDKLVVHTSGSIAMNDLKSNSVKGVLYPLQTFSKERKVDFYSVPLCLEAENEKAFQLLKSLAESISKNSYRINSEQRKSMHVAAVFVNNFVNHLYYQAQKICEENNVPFEVLQALIDETSAKIKTLPPKEAQTGPAKRNDSVTIEKHLKMLPPDQQKIYILLTNSISNIYGEKL